MEFYTNIAVQGKNILHRGYDSSGNRVEFKSEFRPTLYVSSTSTNSPFKTINGKTVEEIQPGTIPDCREFMKQYENVKDYPIYGNTGWVYQYISSLYKKNQEAEYDFSKIKLVTLDIEVESENGFPSIEEASEKINVVTLRTGSKKYVLGTGNFSFPEQTENFYWKQCSCEDELLHDFIEIWREIDPDIATGWNVRIYDFPYIINRIIKILGIERAKKLSPWGSLQKDKIEIWGKECEVHRVVGVSILDYYELYRKYTYSNQESYKLGNIASVELGKEKLDYSEFESLREFYTVNFQKFVEYNIHDVDLVHELDEKMKLIELQLTIAYKAKINYEDAYSPIRTWDTIIYNYLKDQDVVIPQKRLSHKSEQFMGAYVKDPIIGFHDWVVSFDATSLYPTCILLNNLSPDTIVEKIPKEYSTTNINDLLEKTKDLSYLKIHNLCLAANGSLFRKDKLGFMPELIGELFEERKKFKQSMLDKTKELQKIDEELKKRA